MGSIPGSGRSPEGRNGNPLQYSSLENPRGAWGATVHGVAKSWTQLRDYTYTRIQLDDAKNITDSNKSFFLGPHAHLPITGGI